MVPSPCQPVCFATCLLLLTDIFCPGFFGREALGKGKRVDPSSPFLRLASRLFLFSLFRPPCFRPVYHYSHSLELFASPAFLWTCFFLFVFFSFSFFPFTLYMCTLPIYPISKVLSFSSVYTSISPLFTASPESGNTCHIIIYASVWQYWLQAIQLSCLILVFWFFLFVFWVWFLVRVMHSDGDIGICFN
jgi:hypothetical protein